MRLHEETNETFAWRNLAEMRLRDIERMVIRQAQLEQDLEMVRSNFQETTEWLRGAEKNVLTLRALLVQRDNKIMELLGITQEDINESKFEKQGEQ